jgi:CheY-like chemotaxis protein
MRVLLADNEPAVRFVLTAHLRRRGWTVDEVADGAEAVERATAGGYDAVVVDQNMPSLNGLEVARILGDDATVVICSAYLDHASRERARRLGAAVVEKAEIDELIRLLEDAVDADAED